MKSNVYSIYSRGLNSENEPLLIAFGSPNIDGFTLEQLAKHFRENMENNHAQYKNAEIVFPREPKIIFSTTIIPYAINLHPLLESEYKKFMELMRAK